jgi:hypothetical protein
MCGPDQPQTAAWKCLRKYTLEPGDTVPIATAMAHSKGIPTHERHSDAADGGLTATQPACRPGLPVAETLPRSDSGAGTPASGLAGLIAIYAS